VKVLKNSTVIAIIAVAVVFGLAGFLVGHRMVIRNLPGNRFYGRGMMGSQFGYIPQNGMMRSRGSGGVIGQITNVNGNSITIQRTNGQTYTVTLNNNTVINKSAKGAVLDLQTGKSVMVLGNGFNIPQTIWISQ
jgi:hypothetical protein